MKEQINSELENITFHFDMEIAKRKRRKRLRYNILMTAIAVILLGSTVQAGYTLYNRWLKINGETLPELESMQKVEVNPMSEDYKEKSSYEKQYESYEALQKDLGVRLLHTDMADNNSSMIITRKTDNVHWTQIKIVAYIVGDVTGMKRIEGRNQYTWTPGENYFSPIDLSIDIITSQEQLEIGWDKEYLGAYDFVESYQTQQGYKVNILSSGKSHTKPTYQAVFVADGARYTVRGKVDIELLKEILNSFNYYSSKTDNQDGYMTQDEHMVIPNNAEKKYDLSDLLYRQNAYQLGRTYAKETLSIYKMDLLLKTDTPQKVIVVFNDGFLEEIEITDEITEHKIKESGCYGFYVKDSTGAIYDINDIVYTTRHHIEEEYWSLLRSSSYIVQKAEEVCPKM